MNEYDWLSWQDAFFKESEERLSIKSDELCSYGIKPLDDALIGIAKDELIVLGADSGTGKTELALHIARHNAKNGKRVIVYCLEGGYMEVISRMKWRDITDIYYNEYSIQGIEMDYRKWKLNKLKNKTLEMIESRIFEEYKDKYKENLYIYSSKNAFTIDNFLSSLLDFHSLIKADTGNPFDIISKFDADLIIIDHLQYFSLTKPELEIGEITQILKEVKNITENYKIPVILVSHLRKKGKDRGMPDQEDFYGTSNIPKISNTAITIMPNTERGNLASGVFPTYLRIVKSRIGIRTNYAFLVDFYLDKRSYADKYGLYHISNGGDVCKESLKPDQLPRWAEGAK